jgi:putative FmdB family regulatory protein
MPLYDYRCAICGKVTEIRHGFNDTNTEPCPQCGGSLARVFNPAPIIFNGSGFYKTDSRPKEKKSETKSDTKSESSSTSSSSATSPSTDSSSATGDSAA